MTVASRTRISSKVSTGCIARLNTPAVEVNAEWRQRGGPARVRPRTAPGEGPRPGRTSAIGRAPARWDGKATLRRWPLCRLPTHRGHRKVRVRPVADVHPAYLQLTSSTPETSNPGRVCRIYHNEASEAFRSCIGLASLSSPGNNLRFVLIKGAKVKKLIVLANCRFGD